MRQNEEIRRYRGEVIELFSELETIIATIISQHYFKGLNTDFLVNVLYDEQCSFGMKRNILKKILPTLDKDVEKKLFSLNKTRNIFAHCSLELITGNTPGSGTSFFPNPSNPRKGIDFKELRDAFVKDFPSVNQYLLNKLEEMGANVIGRLKPMK